MHLYKSQSVVVSLHIPLMLEYLNSVLVEEDVEDG